MADGSLVVKANFNVAHVDLRLYEDFTETFAKSVDESEHHFAQRLLVYALLHRHNVQINSDNSPELFIDNNPNQHVEHWIHIGAINSALLNKAEASSPHIWVFFDGSDDVRKLLKQINKHPRLQMVEFEDQFIDALSHSIEKQLGWSVMIDQQQISVAVGDDYFQSEFKLHHPLTIPPLDLIH